MASASVERVLSAVPRDYAADAVGLAARVPLKRKQLVEKNGRDLYSPYTTAEGLAALAE
jgi:hypothetical protein